jgi:hypothetical protein
MIETNKTYPIFNADYSNLICQVIKETDPYIVRRLTGFRVFNIAEMPLTKYPFPVQHSGKLDWPTAYTRFDTGNFYAGIVLHPRETRHNLLLDSIRNRLLFRRDLGYKTLMDENSQNEEMAIAEVSFDNIRVENFRHEVTQLLEKFRDYMILYTDPFINKTEYAIEEGIASLVNVLTQNPKENSSKLSRILKLFEILGGKAR